MRFLRKEDGFSLIELLAVTAILGFLLAGIYNFYISGLQTWDKGLDRMELQQSARIGMEKIIRELRYACLVEIPGEGEIAFKKPGDHKTYHFFRNENTNELIFESRTHTVYSHNKVALGITSLIFWTESSGQVCIGMIAGHGAGQVQMRGGVYPRNIQGEEE